MFAVSSVAICKYQIYAGEVVPNTQINCQIIGLRFLQGHHDLMSTWAKWTTLPATVDDFGLTTFHAAHAH